MSAEALPLAAQADYLTETLSRCGVLADGRVRDVKLEGDNPVADCPATLVLRWGAGRRTRFGRSEDRPA